MDTTVIMRPVRIMSSLSVEGRSRRSRRRTRRMLRLMLTVSLIWLTGMLLLVWLAGGVSLPMRVGLTLTSLLSAGLAPLPAWRYRSLFG